jgi:hypothetical protein
MVTAALASFGALFVAWLLAPERRRRDPDAEVRIEEG